MYMNGYGSFQDWQEYSRRIRDIIDVRKIRWISPLSSLRIFADMLFGPTDLFGFKLEMIIEISFLLIGDKKNVSKDGSVL